MTLGGNELFDAMRAGLTRFEQGRIAGLFEHVSQERVRRLADALEAYIGAKLPAAISRRQTFTDYRTNPYVLMTCGSTMRLSDPEQFAAFLVNNKLYMGLETSFGKSIEATVVGEYPLVADGPAAWSEPREKIAEFATYEGMSREERARARARSVWREIDRACVVGGVRYLATIKSGPNTINDTQVNAMKDAIRDHGQEWLQASRDDPEVESIAIVLGLTYGTPRTTNNKDNQLIVKLLESGFVELDRASKPGVLVDEQTGLIQVSRVVGADFWAFIADPREPGNAPFAFLEVLLALAMALREISSRREVEDRLNDRLRMLAVAIMNVRFPRGALPSWAREHLGQDELFWLAGAMAGFFDEGI